jgi:hypothetical protein
MYSVEMFTAGLNEIWIGEGAGVVSPLSITPMLCLTTLGGRAFFQSVSLSVMD